MSVVCSHEMRQGNNDDDQPMRSCTHQEMPWRPMLVKPSSISVPVVRRPRSAAGYTYKYLGLGDAAITTNNVM